MVCDGGDTLPDEPVAQIRRSATGPAIDDAAACHFRQDTGNLLDLILFPEKTIREIGAGEWLAEEDRIPEG